MPGRPIFKAVLQVGDTAIPVKLYSAVREKRVSFHLLHAKDGVRLRQKMYCSKEDKPVPPEERVRGFEVARGQYVILEREEIREARPTTDRALHLDHFVDEHEVGPRLYDRSYDLGPDEDEDDGRRYALLHRALIKTGRAGIGQWAMRGKSYLGLVKPVDDLLVLVTLRYAHELVPVSALELEPRDPREKELKTARRLVDELSGEFDPSAYTNDHQQRILQLIEKKARGEALETRRATKKEPTKPSELEELLERSLEEARAA